MKDSYYLSARKGIEDFCISQSIELVRVFRNDSNYLDMLRGCDGIICLGKFAQEEVKSFIEICSNIVFLDMRVEQYNITSLTMDFKQAVRDALDYLYHLGHRKIDLWVVKSMWEIMSFWLIRDWKNTLHI